MTIAVQNEYQFPAIYTIVGAGTTASTATGAFTANTLQTVNITVPGALFGDLVDVGISVNTQNVQICGSVTAANQITIVYAPENLTVTLGAHNILWCVRRFQAGVN